MEFSFLTDYLDDLLLATAMTVLLTIGCVVLSTLIAAPLAVLRHRGGTAARIVTGYTWIFLTMPQLLVLFLAYYGLPTLNILLPAVFTAIIGLGITTSAYNIEIFRSGILSVPKGQFEAAKALGFSGFRTWRRIILPQAMVAILPPFISNATLAVKGTALAGIITVPELTGVAMGVITETYRPIELLLIVAVVYLIVNSALTGLQALVERRMARQA